MADFKATVERLKIEEHPNADALELAVIGGYRSVVKKGQFQDGDLAVYIPEQAVLPLWLIKELGLEGRLAGKDKNRVKAVRLRNTISQGLVYPLMHTTEKTVKILGDDGNFHYHLVNEGDDVTELLGIEKWEPPIPTTMSGQVWNASGKTLKYDIENFKRYPDIIEDGEEVVFGEKIHGTWCCIGIKDDEYIVSSKGLSAKGLAFKLNGANVNNLYVRQFNELGGKKIIDALQRFTGRGIREGDGIYVLGEIFGNGVQDLKYGQDRPSFRIFDIFVGNPSGMSATEIHSFYLPHDDLVDAVDAINNLTPDIHAELVPVLYRGPFSVEVMNEFTDGKETVSGKGVNIREGIVMKPTQERSNDEIGRVILKNVSGDYLTRKGNVTEYN